MPRMKEGPKKEEPEELSSLPPRSRTLSPTKTELVGIGNKGQETFSKVWNSLSEGQKRQAIQKSNLPEEKKNELLAHYGAVEKLVDSLTPQQKLQLLIIAGAAPAQEFAAQRLKGIKLKKADE